MGSQPPRPTRMMLSGDVAMNDADAVDCVERREELERDRIVRNGRRSRRKDHPERVAEEALHDEVRRPHGASHPCRRTAHTFGWWIEETTRDSR